MNWESQRSEVAASCIPSSTQVGEIEVDDPSLHGQASRPWDLISTPLSGGAFHHGKRYLVTPAFTAYVETFSLPTRVQGLSPPGLLTVAVPIRLGPRSAYWSAERRAPGFPAMLPGSLDVVIDGGQVHLLVLIDLAHLRATLTPEAIEALERAAAGRLLPASSAAVQTFGTWLLGVLDEMVARPGVLDHPAVLQSLEDDLLDRLLRAIEVPATRAMPTIPARRRGLERALEFLGTADADDVTVPALGRAAGLSRRTLEQAFRETLGLTPLHYVKLRRFHRARARLLTATRADASVADVAHEEGFYQLGRFAGRYRELFGERPLQTLQRPALACPPDLR